VAEDWDAVIGAVGARLRALRRERGLTLAELSAETGISVSILSRLESGQRRPTLELLLPLASFHAVQLDALVGVPPTGDPRVHPRPVHVDGATLLPLTQRQGGLQGYKHFYPAQPAPPVPELRTHPGHAWLCVLSGKLRLVLSEEDLVLGPGEAVEFDMRIPHWLGNAGTEPVECLSLFGRQGERATVRLRARHGSTAT
jgi:transcriptional regulator with XRE-family HTH domain